MEEEEEEEQEEGEVEQQGIHKLHLIRLNILEYIVLLCFPLVSVTQNPSIQHVFLCLLMYSVKRRKRRWNECN
jgi:hypothetical protein